MENIANSGSADERRQSDRRTVAMDLDRRSYDRRKRCFLFRKTVYLSDTNAFGNTYFAKYFEWQGMAREAFLAKHLVPDATVLMTSGVKLITAEASHVYKNETLVYDHVLIEVRAGAPKHASVELLFTFKNEKSGKLIGKGRQVIAFASTKGKLIRVPAVIAENLKRFRSGQ